MLRQQLMAAALLVLPTFTSDQIQAQTIQQAPTTIDSSKSAVTVKPGILLDRLAGKDLERWKAMEQMVFATDANQQPLHPTLYGLWQWIDASGHSIYIEVIPPGRTSTCTAGNFSIERYDTRGEHHVGVIRLNFSNIDQAYVGPSAARENGFIPFEGLGKIERYVEVLGHEFAHAVDILTSPERAKAVEFMIEETNELLLKSTPRKRGDAIPSELRKRLSGRDLLLEELERRAEGMEYIVWKEMIRGKALREKSSGGVAAGR